MEVFQEVRETLEACQDPLVGTPIYIDSIKNNFDNYLNILKKITNFSLQKINNKEIYNIFNISSKITFDAINIFKEQVMPLLEETKILAYGGSVEKPIDLIGRELGQALASFTELVFMCTYNVFHWISKVVLVESVRERRMLALYLKELLKALCSLIYIIREHLTLLKEAVLEEEWNRVISLFEGFEYALASISQALYAIAVRALGF